MNHLYRELAPISERAWQAIEDEARTRLVPYLGARKLIDFEGPLGWQYSATALGRTEPLEGPAGEGVSARQRRVLPLVEMRAPFSIARSELDDAERGASDNDFGDLERAARQIALAENEAVFHGFAAGGIRGITEASSHQPIHLDGDFEHYPAFVARAVNVLMEAGIGGPYALALSPGEHTGVIETTEDGGYLVFDHLRRILGGSIVWTPGVAYAVVLSLRGGDFRMQCGQDLSVGYLADDLENVQLYLEQTFNFRVTEPDAAIELPSLTIDHVMEYRTLGRTGVKVSPLCLGAMMFGAWGNPDHDESIAVIHAALDAGINFVDTADVYSAGESEEIVGKALRGRRDDVVLATKVHGTMVGHRNYAGNSRRWIVRACEDSLRRLGTDHLDLYQIHRPDPDCDIDETLGALTDLVRSGKVRYVGSSTFPPSEIVEAQWVAERRNRERFVCEQPPYSMLVRGVELDVLPTCQRYGMGVIPWSPLAGGWLSGRWRKGLDTPTSRRAERLPWRYDMSIPANQRKLDAADALGSVADEAGLSLVHLAVAWVLRHPAVSSAIIGPRTMEQFKSQIDAAEITLERDVLDRIDEIVPPGSNFSLADGGYLPPSVTDAPARRR